MVLADQLTHLISVLLCLSVFHTDKAATHRALRGGLHWSRIMGLIACPSQQVANERSAKQDIWPRRYVGMVSVCVYMCVCASMCVCACVYTQHEAISSAPPAATEQITQVYTYTSFTSWRCLKKTM